MPSDAFWNRYRGLKTSVLNAANCIRSGVNLRHRNLRGTVSSIGFIFNRHQTKTSGGARDCSAVTLPVLPGRGHLRYAGRTDDHPQGCEQAIEE